MPAIAAPLQRRPPLGPESSIPISREPVREYLCELRVPVELGEERLHPLVPHVPVERIHVADPATTTYRCGGAASDASSPVAL